MKDQTIIVALVLAFAWGYGCGTPWPSERVTESESECDVAEAVDRLTEAVRDKECACAEDDP